MVEFYRNRIKLRTEAIKTLQQNKNKAGYVFFTDLSSSISVPLPAKKIEKVRALAIAELKAQIREDEKKLGEAMAHKGHSPEDKDLFLKQGEKNE